MSRPRPGPAAAGLGLLAALLTAAAVAAAGEPGFRGLLAVRGERVLAQENADRLFVPGSVQKLLVTAAALHHLGPEYRAVTTVHAAGPIVAGAVDGDLVIRAGGDPTWNRRFFADDPRAPLRALARALRERGLARVTGDLVIDLADFPGRAAPPSRPDSERAYAYAAPTSGLAVDENAAALTIAPGRAVGDPGVVRPPAGLDVVADVVTVSRERQDRGTVDFQPVWGTPRVRVRGEYPVSEPAYRVELSVPDPERRAGEALLEVLREEGVAVAGGVRLETVRRNSGRVSPEPLAVLRSPPLAEILPAILRDSHNWYAEMLLRQLALAVRGEGRSDEGLDVVAEFLRSELAVPEGSFVLDDASGLSPYDLIAPRTIVALLAWVARQPWSGVFVGALASPGRGTLKVWGALPDLAAKTGSIRETVGLAGYLEPGRATPTIFVCFLNHRGDEAFVLRREIAVWLRELASRLR